MITRSRAASLLLAGILSAGLEGKNPAPGPDPWAVPEDPSKFHIFIFAGQSNMAGGFNGSHEYDDEGNYDPVTDPVPRVLQYRAGGWKPAAHPLTRHVKTSFSLPLPFAERYLEQIDDPEVKVGLVISAFGGKAINFFMPGGSMHPGAAKRMPELGTVKGFIWHQGESDNRMEERETYARKFHALAGLVREYAGNPDLPVVTGAFNPQWQWSNPYSIPPGPEGNPETQENNKLTWSAYESQITIDLPAEVEKEDKGRGAGRRARRRAELPPDTSNRWRSPHHKADVRDPDDALATGLFQSHIT